MTEEEVKQLRYPVVLVSMSGLKVIFTKGNKGYIIDTNGNPYRRFFGYQGWNMSMFEHYLPRRG